MSDLPKPSKSAMLKALAKIAFIEYPRFAARRVANRFKGKKALQRAGSVIVIDLDETLSKTNSVEELLKMKLGESRGAERYQHYRNLVKNGECSLEEAMLRGFQELVKLGVTQDDYRTLLYKLEQEGKIRLDIVNVANYLQRLGRKVILATKSSQFMGDLVAQRYGFDGAIGTREKFSGGQVIGVTQLIGDRQKLVAGHQVTTKLARLREHLGLMRHKFDPQHVSVLSDGYDDIEIFKRAGFSVLLAPEKSGTPQKIAQKFRLRDAEVHESPQMLSELKLRLRYPWTVKAPKRRIEKAAQRLAKLRNQREREQRT